MAYAGMGGYANRNYKNALELRDTKDVLWQQIKDIERQLANLHKRYMELSKQTLDVCTHRYADGTSAWEDHYSYGSCNICGYDDL